MRDDEPLGADVMTDGWGRKAHFKSLRPRWKPIPERTPLKKAPVVLVQEPLPPPLPVKVAEVLPPVLKTKTERRKGVERKDVSHPDVKIAECVVCKPHRFYRYVPVGDDEIAASRKNRIVERVCDRHEVVKCPDILVPSVDTNGESQSLPKASDKPL